MTILKSPAGLIDDEGVVNDNEMMRVMLYEVWVYHNIVMIMV